MFDLYADKTQLTVREREPITSGSVNVYQVRFSFSKDWEGLEQIAVFQAGYRSWSLVLDGNEKYNVPWEALTESGHHLFAGVYGRRGDELVLPTVWADLGMILDGTIPGEESRPSTPELWQQELERKGSHLSYDGLNLSLMSGDRPLSTVQVTSDPLYQFGHGLKVSGLTVSVDAVDDFSGDNTLPMTAAGVQNAVGNIEVLLGTI